MEKIDNIFLFRFDIDVYSFTTFKTRLYDQFNQSWNMSSNNSQTFAFYCKFKKELSYENYLDIITNNEWRKLFACFRLSSHKFENESGHFSGIPREQRCKDCSSNLIENKYHFILCCLKDSVIRHNHLGYVQWPNYL